MASGHYCGHVGDDDGRSDFIGALNNHYFVLQSISSATISEASSRSSLYLLTLSSALVSLGFVIGLAPDVFIPFAMAALTTIFVLGWFTVARLIDTSIENLRAIREMVRIRSFYATLSPEASRFFLAAGDEDGEVSSAMGVRTKRRGFFGTMASMIGAVNSVVGGAGVAIIVGWLAGSSVPGVLTGVVVAIGIFVVVVVVEQRRFRAEGTTA